MSDQFDLEQDIMSCWNVTTDLDVLLEELMENPEFNSDKASNFVLGLTTIYQAKFEKLFRTFEEFVKDHYQQRRDLEAMSREVASLSRKVASLNDELDAVKPPLITDEEAMTDEEIFDTYMAENDVLEFIEDEFTYK